MIMDPMSEFWYWFFQIVLVVGAFSIVGLFLSGVWQLIKFIWLD